MSEHLTELEIYELAAGEDATGRARAHADSCARCASEVAATRRLLGEVERISPAVRMPPDPARRLSRTRLPSRRRSSGAGDGRPRTGVPGWLIRTAAALVLFAAGVGTHALWLRNGESAGPARASAAASSPVLEVQRAGTDYVAAIARLVADSARLSLTQVRIAREVGLAAMAGAAHELRLLPGDAAPTDEIHRLAVRAWTGEPAERQP